MFVLYQTFNTNTEADKDVLVAEQLLLSEKHTSEIFFYFLTVLVWNGVGGMFFTSLKSLFSL